MRALGAARTGGRRPPRYGAEGVGAAGRVRRGDAGRGWAHVGSAEGSKAQPWEREVCEYTGLYASGPGTLKKGTCGGRTRLHMSIGCLRLAQQRLWCDDLGVPGIKSPLVL